MVLSIMFDLIAEDDGPLLILKVASFLITLWVLVDLGFLKGTTGPNRFGPDPLPAPQTLADAPAP